MLVISIIDHWQRHWSVSGGHSSYPQQSNPTQSDPARKHIAENTGAETNVQCALQYNTEFNIFQLSFYSIHVVLVLQNND